MDKDTTLFRKTGVGKATGDPSSFYLRVDGADTAMYTLTEADTNNTDWEPLKPRWPKIKHLIVIDDEE